MIGCGLPVGFYAITWESLDAESILAMHIIALGGKTFQYRSDNNKLSTRDAWKSATSTITLTAMPRANDERSCTPRLYIQQRTEDLMFFFSFYFYFFPSSFSWSRKQQHQESLDGIDQIGVGPSNCQLCFRPPIISQSRYSNGLRLPVSTGT